MINALKRSKGILQLSVVVSRKVDIDSRFSNQRYDCGDPKEGHVSRAELGFTPALRNCFRARRKACSKHPDGW